MTREQRLVEVFVELADTLVAEFDVLDLLQVLTERCVELVATDAAGLMLADRRGNLEVVAATHESARLLDLLELQRREGPCRESFATGRVIANIDLDAARQQWPSFTEAARGLGFRISHAIPLKLRRQVLGVLALHSVGPHPLSTTHVAVARGLADIATIGLLHARALQDQTLLAEQLQTALQSRILLEQAKGVLSAHAETSVEAAFALLRGYARRTGQSLTGVAEGVVAGLIGVDDLQLPPAGDTTASSGDVDGT